MNMKPPIETKSEGIGALQQNVEKKDEMSTSANHNSQTETIPKIATSAAAAITTTNGERLENSKSPISTSTYRETSETPSSNYQDSETTYYELCPHELRVDHENDDQIVIQNLCNRKHEKLNKPCQNGFCYCFTSDSDEVRYSQNNKTNPKFRHKPRKQQSTGSNGDNITGGGCLKSAIATAGKNKISSLAARTQNISPPMPVSSTTSQDGSSGIIEQTTINTGNHKNNTIVKSHRIMRPRFNASSIVKSRLRETFDSDPNAPLVRIIQEIHKNVVISEVRINRDKIKCTRHNLMNNDKQGEEYSSIESGHQTTDEKVEFLIKEKSKLPIFADKKTQTETYLGRETDSRSSSRSGGGRLLLKRIGSDAALKLKHSQDPPRKPPRRRFSSSSQSTKFTETISPVLHEKATSPINIKLLDSPSHNTDNDDEKFKRNPYRKLRESLPTEKEIIIEGTPNYQKASPSCPTLSELSSANTTVIQLPQSNGLMDNNEDKESSIKNSGSSYGESTTAPNIGWVRPEIVDMIHYEARGNTKDFHTVKSQPEPQKQQQKLQQQQQQQEKHMGWTIPPKRDIDTVDNVKLNCNSNDNNTATTTATNANIGNIEDEFNNFASSMESKSTPVKTQILSQSTFSNTNNNRSFMKGKILNRLSTNSPLRLSKRSLGGGEQNVNIPCAQNKEKVIKTTTFRKKATQNTRNFFENSRKKFIRFVFGVNKDDLNNINNINNNDSSGSSDGSYKNGKTVATQTLESELMNSKAASTLSSALTTATTSSAITTTNTFINPNPIKQKSSIYPSIHEDSVDYLAQKQPQLHQEHQQPLSTLSTQPSSLLSSVDNFDFSRKVDSPKKPERAFQRKLKFSPRKALKHFGAGGVGEGGNNEEFDDKQPQQFESYKSYDSDFINNDFRMAAMNDILTSLRLKLETHDEHMPSSSLQHAINSNKFENEIPSHYHQSHHHPHHYNQEVIPPTTIHEELCEESSTITAVTASAVSTDTVQNNTQISARADIHSEPIYSEIEDQQNFTQNNSSVKNLKEITRVVINNDPNAIYAEVHKIPKNHVNVEHYQELNCQTEKIDNNEILLGQDQQQYCHQQMPSKMDGESSSSSDKDSESNGRHQESDVVSYDEPDECNVNIDQNSLCEEIVDNEKSSRKITKDELKFCRLKVDENVSQISEKSFRCNSCPLPRSKYEYLLIHGKDGDNNNLINDYQRNVESENDFPTNHNNNENDKHHYDQKLNHNFKDRLKLSFRRGKKFFKNEKKRLSNILLDKNLKRSDSKNNNNKIWDQSDLYISQLYASEILNENFQYYNHENQMTMGISSTASASVTDKIEKVVSICRQMPEFESSTELVEAERLLLFSSLKRELSDLRKYQPPPSIIKIPPSSSSPSSPSSNSNKCRIQIDSFEIPIKSNGNHDMFFNYFYIGVFVSGTIIKSTQSVEKRNNLVIFSNCNIIFDNLETNFGIRCYVYVLRLRKLCNLNLTQQPKRPQRKIINNCSSDSGDEMISRFRLQGSFVIIAPNFAPYQINEKHHHHYTSVSPPSSSSSSSDDNDKIYLNSFSTCIVPLTTMSRSTNLCKEVKITANIDLTFPKFELKGFLNIEDKNKRHNWNQRWCQLNQLKLYFWDYPQDCNEKEPLLIINLMKCISYPIEIANPEVCARPKSFSIQITEYDHSNNDNNDKFIETYFLSTDNQKDLNYWITGLNKIIEFVRIWLY